jgi:hypothetical protein
MKIAAIYRAEFLERAEIARWFVNSISSLTVLLPRHFIELYP